MYIIILLYPNNILTLYLDNWIEMLMAAATLYIAYLFMTRASTVPKLKSCTDCSFFIPPINDLTSDYAVRTGRCALFPYSDNTVKTLLPGIDEPIGLRHRFASTARYSESMCGESAVNFVPKKPSKKRNHGKDNSA